MCFDDEAGPPIPPMAGGSVGTERLHLTSGDGTRFAAFAANASATPSEPAMLVLPDVRGLHRYYEELAMRFAEAGIDALAIDYFGRTATTDDRSDAFRFMDHVSRTAYPTMTADIEAGATHLRVAGQRRLFTIGFCFGGRLALLTATMPGLDASGAVGFYGPPVGSNRVGVPAPADLAPDNRAPVLAIFGGADDSIPPDAVAIYEAALTATGAAHEIVTYPAAPHGFFDRRQADFADASADAWRRVLDFVRAAG